MPARKRKTIDPAERFCVKCGKRGPFRSPGALQCIACDEDTKVDRKTYHQHYHQARGLAVSRLIKAHQREYDRLFTEARSEIEEEAKPKRRRSAS